MSLKSAKWKTTRPGIAHLKNIEDISLCWILFCDFSRSQQHEESAPTTSNLQSVSDGFWIPRIMISWNEEKGVSVCGIMVKKTKNGNEKEVRDRIKTENIC